MPFAAALRESLEIRGGLLPSEFTRGDSLEHVLDRHLMTVEQNFDGELITSVLLLSADGRRLSHGAGPNLPASYRQAIDGSEIGPCAGSCGTAAFFGRPVYVTDIATDPLWADYSHLALPHGFRSCWSTPIRDDSGSVIGTFATYHRTGGRPTAEEIEAISIITDHVAQAIMWDRGLQDLRPKTTPPKLKLVDRSSEPDMLGDWPDSLLRHLQRLESLVGELDRSADSAETEGSREALKAAAADSRRLIDAIRYQVEQSRCSD
jgi:GAF domain